MNLEVEKGPGGRGEEDELTGREEQQELSAENKEDELTPEQEEDILKFNQTLHKEIVDFQESYRECFEEQSNECLEQRGFFEEVDYYRNEFLKDLEEELQQDPDIEKVVHRKKLLVEAVFEFIKLPPREWQRKPIKTELRRLTKKQRSGIMEREEYRQKSFLIEKLRPLILEDARSQVAAQQWIYENGYKNPAVVNEFWSSLEDLKIPRRDLGSIKSGILGAVAAYKIFHDELGLETRWGDPEEDVDEGIDLVVKQDEPPVLFVVQVELRFNHTLEVTGSHDRPEDKLARVVFPRETLHPDDPRKLRKLKRTVGRLSRNTSQQVVGVFLRLPGGVQQLGETTQKVLDYQNGSPSETAIDLVQRSLKKHNLLSPQQR